MLNFIPTPRVVMNELFHEPTEHDRMQDTIYMFTLHIHSTTTQRTYQHCDKVNTWTSKEIFNSHIISIVIWKNIVNSSISIRGNISNGENNAWVNKMSTSQLLVCHYVILKTTISPSCYHELWANNLHRPTTQCCEHS
jgi:hypothetical protein